MNKISTNVLTHKLITFDGKEVLLNVDQLKAYLTEKKINPRGDIFIAGSLIKMTDVRRIEEVDDYKKEHEVQRNINECKSRSEEFFTAKISIEESREQAKKYGHKGMAWQCDCGYWNPQILIEDTDKDFIERFNRHPYKTSDRCFNHQCK